MTTGRFYRLDENEKTRNVRVKFGGGITGAAASGLQTIVVNDFREDSRYIEMVDCHDCR